MRFKEHRLVVRARRDKSAVFLAKNLNSGLKWIVKNRRKIGIHWIEYLDEPSGLRGVKTNANGSPRRKRKKRKNLLAVSSKRVHNRKGDRNGKETQA